MARSAVADSCSDTFTSASRDRTKTIHNERDEIQVCNVHSRWGTDIANPMVPVRSHDVTLYVKRGHSAQIMTFELLVPGNSTCHDL